MYTQEIGKLINIGCDINPDDIESIKSIKKSKKGANDLRQFLEHMLTTDPESDKIATQDRVIVLGSSSLIYDTLDYPSNSKHDCVRISLPNTMIYKPSYSILIVSDFNHISLARFVLDYSEKPIQELTVWPDGGFKLNLKRIAYAGLSFARLQISTSSTAETYLLKIKK